MRILHLTDTHYLNDLSLKSIPPILQEVFNKQLSFTAKLKLLAASEDLTSFDLVIVTGDLVHESNAENYRELFALLAKTFGDTPVYYALGNHDNKSEFHLAKFGQVSEACYDYEFVHAGHHFIVLDSAKAGESLGSFNPEQLEWLKESLAKNTLPKLIFMHHPLFGGQSYEQYCVLYNQAVIELLQEYEVVGIFNGHTHQVGQHVLGNLRQYTSYCFAFGIDHVNVQEVLTFNNLVGYSVIEIDQALSVFARILTPMAQEIVSIDRSAIAKHAEEQKS